ncbi:FG-GAP repeat protein [Candidatus Sumerlaeota bacterium]|nr:FG-GAP repeat protein [Candidatus Sumerlaeota bacterium]
MRNSALRNVIHATFMTAMLLAAAGAAAQTAEFVAADTTGGDRFGTSVAIEGDLIVVGADGNDDAGSDSGSAYVFEDTGTTWTEVAKLVAGDAAAADWFGKSVSISGDTAVVGAYGKKNTYTYVGAAYIYIDTGSAWTQQQKLMASDWGASGYFGTAVDIDGDTAVVGAMDYGASAPHSTGAVYVFTRTAGVWTQQQKLKASDAASQDEMGKSVAISGDTIVAGSPNDDTTAGNNAGSAYIFTRSGGVWTQQAKLLPSDEVFYQSFGNAVDIDGDTVVIGRAMDGDGGVNAGAAYVFVREGGTTWTQQQKLAASDAAFADSFGSSVAISGDTAVVGAKDDDHPGADDAGSAYVFTRTGTSWTEDSKLTAPVPVGSDSLGGAVAIDGNVAVAGARYRDTAATDSGSALAFTLGPVTHTVDFETDGTPGATLTGDTSQVVNDGEDCTPVTANAPVGYHFVKWTESSVDYATSNPLTVTNVTQSMTLQAVFAINEYNTRFRTDGTPGATLTGTTTQRVPHGSDCTPVTANAPADYLFVKWTRYGSDYSTDNPLTITNVTGTWTFIANFEVDDTVLRAKNSALYE